MQEYIEREALVNTLKLLYCRDCEGHENYGDISCRACRTGDTLAMVEDFPAVERVRGEWIEDGYEGVTVCSYCGVEPLSHPESMYTYVLSRFCPNCGADMREEEE